MRNRKLFAILMAGSLSVTLNSLAAHGATLGISTPEGDYTYRYYETPADKRAAGKEGEDKGQRQEDGVPYEEISSAVPSAESQMSPEEYEKQLRAEKQQFKESLAWLEPFGVTYSIEKDAILYKGRTVRYLTDERQDWGSFIYSTPGGETDLYVVRDQEGAAVGIREATETEYKKNSELISGAVLSREVEAVDIEAQEGDQKDVPLIQTYVYSAWEDSGEAEVVTDDTADASLVCEKVTEITAAAEGGQPSPEALALESLREKEYAGIGITRDDNGSWVWNGEKVYFLLDDDGSISMNNGTGKSKENRIYLYVSRDEDGKAVKAEAVTGKGILEKKAELDRKEDSSAE